MDPNGQSITVFFVEFPNDPLISLNWSSILYLGSINFYIFFVVIDIFNLYCCRTVWSTDAKIPAVRKR